MIPIGKVLTKGQHVQIDKGRGTLAAPSPLPRDP